VTGRHVVRPPAPRKGADMNDILESPIPVAPAFRRKLPPRLQALCPWCDQMHWVVPGDGPQKVYCQGGTRPLRYWVKEIKVPEWLLV
jgi:hypothetical protein